MICECKQLSCGLLLYRRGVDLALKLSKTLALMRDQGGSILSYLSPPNNQTTSETSDIDDNLEYVCNVMNTHIYI